MALFASWDSVTVATIVGAFMLALKFAEKIYDNWREDIAAKKLAVVTEVSAAKVAAKVNEVKTSAAEAAVEIKGALKASEARKTAHLEEQDKVLQTIATHVNGLNEQIKEAGRAEGVLQQKDKESSKPDGTGEAHIG